MQSEPPSSESDHQAWIQAATRWGEVVALRWSLPEDLPAEDKSRFDAAHKLMEERFHEWMVAHYGALHSLSYLPRPVMLHQIPKYMAHRLATKGARKLAVIVVDGLSMAQWAIVREELPSRKWVTEEFGLFAWVPTLTSVSRQSIFAGDPPFFFGQSLDTTRKEEQHWTRFWNDRGIRKGEVVYASQGTLEDDNNFIKRIIEKIERQDVGSRV